MPVGEPGGPDTEMFWDFGAELKLHENSLWFDKPCHVNCDCGRFVEIGNNVFMEYQKTESGFEKLKQRNVDFGGGLERMAAALKDNQDVFQIDLFDGMRNVLEEISNKRYGDNTEETYAYRVILDHLRAATFLVCDGAVPSNKDQGYFTRRLMRRSVRFAQKLGITENFCARVSEKVIEMYKDAYPELVTKKDYILLELGKEEEKFRRTLATGLKMFEQMLKTVEAGVAISADEAFDLYQSYGFPIEITEELARERNVGVDIDGFREKLKAHQDLSRQGAEKKFKGGLADHSDMSVKYHTATHLLHAALRKVLGPHAEQKGSNITPERLRFDFAHPTKMTPEEIKATEDLVNAAIQHDYPVSWQELPMSEAKRLNAIGLFEEKYGDTVKVYTVGDPAGLPEADPTAPTFSREFCGGPHVEHTGTIGKFKIVKEEACSAGIRRIKAIVE
jgi:alanyl-tRNA synthetase